MSTQSTAARFFGSCLLGAVSGFGLVVLSGILHKGSGASLLGLAAAGVKTMALSFLIMLTVVGFIWGLVFKWPYSFGAAICQVASLPVVAVIEMVIDPTSHNLWPFEFAIYAALSLFSLFGMIVGFGVKSVLKTRVT